MDRGSRIHIKSFAEEMISNSAGREVRAEMKDMMYQAWLACETPEDREKVWAVASGAETFWRLMETYGRQGSMDEVNTQLKRAIA